MRETSKRETATTSEMDRVDGRVLQDGELDAVCGGRKAGGGQTETYLKYELKNVYVTSYQL